MEAVERYGVVRGGLMAGWRVLRCHPLAKGGLDPVVKEGGPQRLMPSWFKRYMSTETGLVQAQQSRDY